MEAADMTDHQLLLLASLLVLPILETYDRTRQNSINTPRLERELIILVMELTENVENNTCHIRPISQPFSMIHVWVAKLCRD